MIGLLKGPISVGKGLVATGSLGGICSFFTPIDSLLDVARKIQISVTEEWNDWGKGFILPSFDSGWLGGAFEKQTKYSYGYVVRAVDSGASFTKDNKRVKDLSPKDPEGKLWLIEKVGSEGIIKSTEAEEQIGLTPKKFVLIGSNRRTGEVELTGLVSLIQYKHLGIKEKCGIEEEKGAIQNGWCDNSIFKTYKSSEERPKFIGTKLKNPITDEAVTYMGLNLKSGNLGIIWGSKGIGTSKQTRKWSRTGYLYINSTNSKKKKAWTRLDKNGTAGFFVVHDLKFIRETLKDDWRYRYEKYGTILGGKERPASYCKAKSSSKECGKVIDIPLSSNRNYYIWDPTKTKIKGKKMYTESNSILPWKINSELTFTSEQVG
ncbi:hypothetical protein WEN_01530 [Mycoplasma wenyonii str. Massachusetts]|uniref:Uncharacterized protein n=1 Tax=Mycoplasma wenyonii (strain Massachusetts) TaxID=1197325 RepID=I6YAV7_MYCWM|nr:hypothetical protein [Mycoplasma wenyonii]AFN65101.1 hypothetical protein WEN_01530 [Mycoplasma wenyonii str. Massachusetts]